MWDDQKDWHSGEAMTLPAQGYVPVRIVGLKMK